MRPVLLAVVLLMLGPAAATAAGGQDFDGSWSPPQTGGASYRITNAEESEEGFVGRVTDGILPCTGAPDIGDVFWTAKQEGSLSGGGTYAGRTFLFRPDDQGGCEGRSVRAKFWPLVADRLRICPAPFDAPESEPALDTKSAVDASPTCTDFVRTEDPVEPKPHVAGDYLGKIFRDDNSCATDYNVTLRYVEDDPMNNVKVFLKRGSAPFKRFRNNELFLPLETDAGRKRILDFRWIKRGPLTVKVTIRTQSGKTFSRKRAFSACKP